MVTTPFEVLGKTLSLEKTAAPDGVPVTLVGFGLRKKKVVLVKVSVYVAAHYVGQPQDWRSDDAAASLKRQSKRFLTLTFLRDVGGDKIKGAFADSLESNGLDPKRDDIAKVLTALTTDMKEGSRMTFLGLTDPGKPQKLIVSGAQGPVEISGATVVDDIWKMWFGKPADGGIEELQDQLAKQLPQ